MGNMIPPPGILEFLHSKLINSGDDAEGGIFEATLRPSDRAIARASDRAIDRSTERSTDRAVERSSELAIERS